jgi:folate-binding protein YgfZ
MPRVRADALRYDGVMGNTRAAFLPDCSVLAAMGRDARSFLQGQLSNDILGLERHPGLLAAACNRQGRVLATLRLAASGDDVLMLLHRDLAPTLAGQLSQFVLRAQVRFEDRSGDIEVAGLMDAPPDPRWSQAAAAAAGLVMLVASPRRILLAGGRAALDAALAAIPRTTPEVWDLACIAAGEASIFPATAALWLPQMLNLDLIGGLSFSKGCYVGQEIVARTQHLGRLKRRTLRYVGPPDAALSPAQALFSGETLAAQVAVAARDETSTQCLAVVELRYCSDLLGAKPGGSEFVPADLPYAIPAPLADGEE